MNFCVYYNDVACGFVNSYKDGAFFVFSANCDIVNLDICRIILKSDEKELVLGVLMPKNGRYVLKKSFPYSYITKLNLNEDFKAYIFCNNQQNTIYNNISDKNLKKCINADVFKQSFANFDMYSFNFNEKSPFVFDFCITMCDFQNNRIYIKTDKNGKIL